MLAVAVSGATVELTVEAMVAMAEAMVAMAAMVEAMVTAQVVETEIDTVAPSQKADVAWPCASQKAATVPVSRMVWQGGGWESARRRRPYATIPRVHALARL